MSERKSGSGSFNGCCEFLLPDNASSMTVESWLIFVTIWIAATLPLGPNALNCVAVSAVQGFRSSLWSAVGTLLAAGIHLIVAVSGIAAFMAANPVVFDGLRWIGVGYLAWMGLTLLLARRALEAQQVRRHRSALQQIRRAMLVSLSNPKAIFGWLAIFTQFINADAPLWPQLMILAPTSLSIVFAVYVGYCALGASVNRLLSDHRKVWIDRLAGSTYLAFAIGLAVTDLQRR